MGLFNKKPNYQLLASKSMSYLSISKAQYLSLADINMRIVNLMDAKKNLTTAEYENIKLLYDEIKNSKGKVLVSPDKYLEVVTKTIAEYEKYAPYMMFDGIFSAKVNPDFRDLVYRQYNAGNGYSKLVLQFALNALIDV